ncbi:MAG: hypothetical protein P0121_02120 [Nitrospira sp.]|nr:hypothetical protein [Nitrospira sp.]
MEQMTDKNWKWRGRSVKLLDGTTVSMTDTQSNQAAHPQSGEQQPGARLPGCDAGGTHLALHQGGAALGNGAVLGKRQWRAGAVPLPDVSFTYGRHLSATVSARDIEIGS